MMKNEKTVFELRAGRAEDCGILYDMIREFAAYIHAEDKLSLTEDKLRESLFVKKQADVLLAFAGETPAGYAVFHPNYCTWLGMAGLFLEDIFIREQYRRDGLGSVFFAKLAQTCIERGYGRMEWCCRDWNTTAVDFYLKKGAEQYKDLSVYRMELPQIRKLAEGN